MKSKYYARQGAQLKTWRLQAGLTVEGLATNLQLRGIAMPVYSVINVESGSSTLYASTWPHYLAALGRPYESPPEYFALKNGEPKTRQRKPDNIPLSPQAVAPGEFPELEKRAKAKGKNVEAKAKLNKRLNEIKTEYRKATQRYDEEYLRAVEAHQAKRLEQCAPFYAAREAAEADAYANFENETLNSVF